MGKKIRQPWKGGNTDLLSDELIRGAEENGHAVTKFYLAQNDITIANQEWFPVQPCLSSPQG